jgi:hypothetical protein
VAVWFFVYWILPGPLDTVFVTLTGLAFVIWLYNRMSHRLKLSPLRVKFERVETITLTHVFLGLILLVMIVSYSELVKIKNGTSDVQTSITNLQNSDSHNTDEIKSKLDDVTSAVETNQ